MKEGIFVLEEYSECFYQFNTMRQLLMQSFQFLKAAK